MSVACFNFDVPRHLWLSMNDRKHRHDAARRTATLRADAAFYGWHLKKCLAAGRDEYRDADGVLRAFACDASADWPLWSQERPCQYVAVIGWPTSRRSDSDNAMPTVKALLDGLVDAGLMSDDADAVIWRRAFARDSHKARKGFHRVRLEIWDAE